MRNLPKASFLVPALLLAAGVFLPAQNDNASFGDGTGFPELREEPPDFPQAGEEKELETPQAPETPKEKQKFRFKNRMVEMSIASVGLDFSNDFIAVSDIIRNPFYLLVNINDVIKDPGLIWEDPIVVNMDNFFDGFRFNFDTVVKPVSLNFNWKDKWGFGLDIDHIDITGNLSLSGNVVTFSETKKDQFGVGGAVFVDVGVPVFFYYNDFKIKLRPAAYVPVVYTEPKVSYKFTNIVKEIDNGEYIEKVEGTRYDIKYEMKVYSLVSMEGIQDGDMKPMAQRLLDNAGDIPKHLGYDFGLSVEYPWRYDIDIGVDVVNIPVPFAGASLNHYMQLNGSVWADLSGVNVTDHLEDEEGNTKSMDDLKGTAYDFPDEFTPEYKYNANGKKIYRPFAMVFYANYRPYESHPLTLIPSLGFSINFLYPQIAAIEGGLTARFDANAANMFITTAGIHYNDRRWINSIGFIMNLRVVEFDFGISFQSQDFVRSWQGAGLGINLGLKFGW